MATAAQEGSGGAKGGEAYLKKLLGVAKRSLEDHKRKLKERDEMVERQNQLITELRASKKNVVELAKRAQRRIEDLEMKNKTLSESQAEEGTDSVLAGALPIGVLIRVKQVDGPTWCLAKLEDPSSEMGWTAQWLEDDEIYVRLGDHDLPFELPPMSYVDESAAKAQEAANKKIEELSAALANVKEKLHKTKVRSEVVLKQRNSEIKQLSTRNQSFEQHNVLSQDFIAQAEATKIEMERLSALVLDDEKRIVGLKTQNAQLLDQIRILKEKNADLASKADAAVAAAAAATKTQQLDSALQSNEEGDGKRLVSKSSTSSSSSAMDRVDMEKNSGTTKLIEQYSKLEREYEKYRQHIQNVFAEKDAQVEDLERRLAQGAESNSSGPGMSERRPSLGSLSVVSVSEDDPQRAAEKLRQECSKLKRQLKIDRKEATDRSMYTKNILLKYMAATEAERQPIEAALATALQFTPEEVKSVQDTRIANLARASESKGWFGFS